MIAPVTSFDFHLARGDQIVIEERKPDEVTFVLGRRLAAQGACSAAPLLSEKHMLRLPVEVVENGTARKMTKNLSLPLLSECLV